MGMLSEGAGCLVRRIAYQWHRRRRGRACLAPSHAPTEGKEPEVFNAASEDMHTLLGDWNGEWDKLEDVAEVVDGSMKLWVASVPQRYSGEVTGKEG